VKIPYGLSSFAEVRRNGYFYVDKTPFLPVLEDLGPRYLLFLRPRRMGKSLFVSLLEHYYDAARADQFDALFRGLWIHEHPTPERSRYLVLWIDFAQVGVDGGEDALRRSFLETVRAGVSTLLARHVERVPAFADLAADLGRFDDASALMSALIAAVAPSGHQLYVLIDEYDNFANRLLAAGQHDVYESLVTRTGFVRSFYATLKTGTASGTIARMFLTGVAPLLLDDLSSGFNIATHVSQDPDLQALAGFVLRDVERGIDELLAAHPQLTEHAAFADRAHLTAVLTQYYDGYRFSPQAEARVYNADMVLYFLSEVDRTRGYPTEMLDFNVRTDYGRLQHIGMLSGAERGARRALLETIAAEGGIQSPIERQFGVRKLSAQTHFVSLLYYLGMLTLGEQPPDQAPGVFGYRLEIPNRVIRELGWEHLAIMLRDEGDLAIDTREIEAALFAMAIGGDIAPFLALFHERVVKALGIKDLRRFDEKAVKLMLLAFISLSRIFFPLSEKEFAQGYCDLFLGVSPIYAGARFAWLLELKYLPTGAKAPQIERAFREAMAQVARYAGDPRLVPLLTRGQGLKAGALVFVGATKVLFRPWPPAPAPASPKRKRAAPRPPRS
jgi:hypothetical protein